MIQFLFSRIQIQSCSLLPALDTPRTEGSIVTNARQLLIFAVVAASCHTISLAKEAPDARQAISAIGQEIQFQDEVKAVSYSRSTDGFYLSFGAPYPHQVLSVWVDHITYDQLPVTNKLVGRTVRIRGKLEASPTGPLLKLASLDQFQVVEADEAILSQMVLDGKKDRDQFKGAVGQLFGREEFLSLERLAEALRASQELSADGAWLLDTFFFALHIPPNAPDEDFAFAEEKLRRWAAFQPGSLVLALLQAQFHRDLAWHAVKTGELRSTTPEHRRIYRNEMTTARQILDSNTSAKIYPEYYEFMQSIAICQRWPRAEFFALFNEASSSHPQYYLFYDDVAEYLLPRWQGKPGEWEAFAEKERLHFGAGGAGDALYARIGWSMKHRYQNMFRETSVSWEEMASGFEYLMREFPQSKFLKNAYANFAWKAGDQVRLRKALADIRRNPDMEIWVNLENVALAEKFARSDTSAR